jgi:hypothetical protein
MSVSDIKITAIVSACGSLRPRHSVIFWIDEITMRASIQKVNTITPEQINRSMLNIDCIPTGERFPVVTFRLSTQIPSYFLNRCHGWCLNWCGHGLLLTWLNIRDCTEWVYLPWRFLCFSLFSFRIVFTKSDCYSNCRILHMKKPDFHPQEITQVSCWKIDISRYA